MAKMINKSGGAIINVDYGDDGYFNDSIRGIKNHKYVESTMHIVLFNSFSGIQLSKKAKFSIWA